MAFSILLNWKKSPLKCWKIVSCLCVENLSFLPPDFLLVENSQIDGIWIQTRLFLGFVVFSVCVLAFSPFVKVVFVNWDKFLFLTDNMVPRMQCSIPHWYIGVIAHARILSTILPFSWSIWEKSWWKSAFLHYFISISPLYLFAMFFLFF